MSALPSGTVTFLFTDIEGSSQLWEEHPKAMRGALARHNTILEQTIEANKGYIFRVGGDAYYAAFSEAPPALAAATAAQLALYNEDWGPIARLRVRMVLHTGLAETYHGDYLGSTLNLLGRLVKDCHGG